MRWEIPVSLGYTEKVRKLSRKERRSVVEQVVLKSVDSELVDRNGQLVEILGQITEPNEEFDAEVLPMMRIRFADGFETVVWPDELRQG